MIDPPIMTSFVKIFLFSMVRPANVPEGAHVQWEIELIDFEMPKVTKQPILIFFFALNGVLELV